MNKPLFVKSAAACSSVRVQRVSTQAVLLFCTLCAGLAPASFDEQAAARHFFRVLFGAGGDGRDGLM